MFQSNQFQARYSTKIQYAYLHAFASKGITLSAHEKETESFKFNVMKSWNVDTLRFHPACATVGMVLSCIKKKLEITLKYSRNQCHKKRKSVTVQLNRIEFATTVCTFKYIIYHFHRKAQQVYISGFLLHNYINMSLKKATSKNEDLINF